jgi:hypothetical protein
MRHGRSSENQIIGVLREHKADAKTSPGGRPSSRNYQKRKRVIRIDML